MTAPSRRTVGLIALGAGLLVASYPPFHLPILSFVAATPAVVLLRQVVRERDFRRALQWGFWYGFVAHGLVLYWLVVALWHFTPLSALGYLATIAIFGLWHAALFGFAVRVRERLPSIPLWVVFPIAWTALEWIIGHQGDIRFPWLGLGTSLADAPVLVQWAELAGARGVTLWLVWCNVMLVDAFVDRNDASYVVRRVGIVAVTVLLALTYGVWRMKTLPVRELGTVGLVQPNEGFREKWDPAHADSVVGKLIGMSRRTLAGSRLDLLVWPEAAIPDFLWRNPAWEAAVSGLARESGTPILTGTLHAVPEWRGPSDPYYNAALFVDATGEWRHWPVYAKHYLVPVVERVPFVPVRLFRAVPGLARWSGGFSSGRDLPVYASRIGRFGVLICYESAFEDLARKYRRAGADFLVNITNDAWFGRTAGPYQHASHLVLRAIETRIGIARAANSGISQFVDPLGRTQDATGLEEEASVVGRLRSSDVVTLYVRLGDWVGMLAVLATLGLAGVLAVQAWKRRVVEG